MTKLSSGVHRCLTGAAVTQVQAGPHGARVTWQPTSSQLASSQLASSQPRSEEFDEVVLATQANVSGRILRTECSATVAALNAFEYETHRVVLHTDERLMPAVQSGARMSTRASPCPPPLPSHSQPPIGQRPTAATRLPPAPCAYQD